jgi:ethanolamine kinase
VSGGISNVNAKLSPKAELGLEPVMFKVFGDKTEQIIDRDAEKVVVVALGQQGFGPKVRQAECAVPTPQLQQLPDLTQHTL